MQPSPYWLDDGENKHGRVSNIDSNLLIFASTEGHTSTSPHRNGRMTAHVRQKLRFLQSLRRMTVSNQDNGIAFISLDTYQLPVFTPELVDINFALNISFERVNMMDNSTLNSFTAACSLRLYLSLYCNLLIHSISISCSMD
jgi:hypothetical protein